MGLGIARRQPRGRLTPLTPLKVHLLQRLLYPGHRTWARAAGAIRARLRRSHPGCPDSSQALLRNAHPSGQADHSTSVVDPRVPPLCSGQPIPPLDLSLATNESGEVRLRLAALLPREGARG